MNDKSLNEEHAFFSRGCCQPPNLYQKNEDIFQHRCSKLDSYNWLKDLNLSDNQEAFDCVEVRFKNSRKEFFRLSEGMECEEGDLVAVEASPGHDIGVVSLSGELVRFQMKRRNADPASDSIRKIYRKARVTDTEKWIMAVEREDSSLFRSREIARELKLEMKINDVEYQGDNTKAIFYYTAEERVDFRSLIKFLADEFKVRIEMRQIGVRQEASRLGGIGSCGRELCCSTWLTDFKSVTTHTARIQQLSMNPQKLAGQCGKLKCCLNYEYSTYKDAFRNFPAQDIVLKSRKGEAAFQKSDAFRQLMWYSYINDSSSYLAIPVEKVKEIIAMNKKKKFPDNLEDFAFKMEQKAEESGFSEDDLSRFDK